MSDQRVAVFFDRFAGSFDTLYDGRRTVFMRWVDRKFRSDMFIRFALTFDRLGDLKDKSVLDIGCGSGPYMVEALKRGAHHVTGLDPAPRMLDLARRRLEAQGFRNEQFQLVRSLFPDGDHSVYDFAIVMGVLDYVGDPESFLRALRTRVNIAAVASVPSTHWFRSPVRKARYQLRQCPVHFYERERIESLAIAAGFGSIDIYKIPGAGMDFHVCLRP